MTKAVNCRSDYRFQVDIRTPSAAGTLAAPTLGAITNVKVRLSATRGGAALHANVDALSASEATTPGRFYVTVNAQLLADHVLGLVGDGGVFWAVWSKAGDIDKVSVRFRAVDGETI